MPLNITPEQMSVGMKWLANKMYSPEFFGERLLNFMEAYEPGPGPQERRTVASRAGHPQRYGCVAQTFPAVGREK